MKRLSEFTLIIKPKGLRCLGVFYNSAQAIWRYILLPGDLYEKILSKDPGALAVLRHEETHLIRARDVGLVKWYTLYLCNRQFRLAEETEAIYQEFICLKKYGFIPDLDKKAQILSGWIYGRMISYSKAIELVSKLYDRLK